VGEIRRPIVTLLMLLERAGQTKVHLNYPQPTTTTKGQLTSAGSSGKVGHFDHGPVQEGVSQVVHIAVHSRHHTEAGAGQRQGPVNLLLCARSHEIAHDSGTGSSKSRVGTDHRLDTRCSIHHTLDSQASGGFGHVPGSSCGARSGVGDEDGLAHLELSSADGGIAHSILGSLGRADASVDDGGDGLVDLGGGQLVPESSSVVGNAVGGRGGGGSCTSGSNGGVDPVLGGLEVGCLGEAGARNDSVELDLLSLLEVVGNLHHIIDTRGSGLCLCVGG